jgi:hypothetical protein
MGYAKSTISFIYDLYNGWCMVTSVDCSLFSTRKIKERIREGNDNV